MPRNRHARKKSSLATAAPVPGGEGKPFSAHPSIDPFNGRDPQKDMIQSFIDSASLAAEPEFLDLEFDQMRAIDVTDRHLTKYQGRLKKARMQGPRVLEEISDEMHIEIVTELVTPAFRLEFQRRLLALRERLQLEMNNKKLQMVMVLETALEVNAPPISMSGLINQIYTRTLEQSLQDFRDEKELFEGVKTDFDFFEASPQEIYDLLESPEKLKSLETELVKNPGLAQRLEEQVNQLMDDFESELAEGSLELELFTLEELVLPFQRLEGKLGDTALSFDTSDENNQKQVVEMIEETIAELLTAERWRKFYGDVQETARKWILDQHEWSAALQAELGLLNKDAYELSLFVISVYFGQLRRLGQPKKSKRSKKRA